MLARGLPLGSASILSRHDGIDTFVKGKARVRLGELLGDIDRAKEVLAGLAELLDDLDDDVFVDTDDSASGGTKHQKSEPK